MTDSANKTDSTHGASSNGALTKEQIIEAIRPVTEPEIGDSLVDLKWIPEVAYRDGTVYLTVELPTPAYASSARGRLEADLRSAVVALPGSPDLAITWTHRVRASGSGKTEAQPIPGVKNIVAVASGKGGVGKSTVAVNLAIALANTGAKVGLLDTDVYGPSIPLMMGRHDKPAMRNNKILPLEAHGVLVMSIGFILDPDKALIWRGPLIARLLGQFLNDVDWGELDYLILDLPPGTGDVQLTLVQSIPISGAVIVTTPQEVALADAIKGMRMFQEVKTPVLGLIENMSGFVCPNCQEVHPIFGEGGGKRVAEANNVTLLGQIPIEPAVREGGDTGRPVVAVAPDSVTGTAFRDAAERVAMKLAIDATRKPRKPTLMLRTVR